MTIEIRPARWQQDADRLSAVRRRVFIEEQGVPEHLELDEHDAEAWHWLALADGGAIGTVRMLPHGHIGRMAVLEGWRDRGVGSQLLEAAIDCARRQELREVYLHAQLSAVRFYDRHGFTAEGPEFIDAGILHRSMRLLLRARRELGRDGGRFAARDRRAVALDLAQQCRRSLRILSNTLDHDLYSTEEFADAVSELARRSRYSEVRLLVVESKPLAQRSHQLLALQRRLSSAVGLRRVSCEPEDIQENYLIADDRGILCYTLRDPDQAWSDYNNGPIAENYRTQFDELWHRAIDDPELRLLTL